MERISQQRGFPVGSSKNMPPSSSSALMTRRVTLTQCRNRIAQRKFSTSSSHPTQNLISISESIAKFTPGDKAKEAKERQDRDADNRA